VKTVISVREYARLGTDTGTGPVMASLDRATLCRQDFDWLCEVGGSFRRSGAVLLQVENRQWLRLDNYVGVLDLPSGAQLEILPKHHEHGDDVERTRAMLRRMVQAALDLPTRDAGPASLALFDAPLSEWVIAQFLARLDALVKRGLRSDYRQVEEEQRYLRGQLDLPRQVRQMPGRQHLFHLRHDVFSLDRAENRLLRAALGVAAAHTAVPANWQLAHELLGRLASIEPARDVALDFKAWRHDRLMAHYAPLKPWCELLLHEWMPLASQGGWRGISMLFPMEKLFERYVESALARRLPSSVRMTRQAGSRHLCQHLERPAFQLSPDILLAGPERAWIVDAKWKRISNARGEDNYGLSQGDLYQMYAYGNHYLGGAGDIVLVYPRRHAFSAPLAPFHFSETLTLWVVPFDMEDCTFMEPRPSILPLLPALVELADIAAG
jgi:5-methylcytosine-specific restriction enzyme subunit McrC